MSVHNNKAGAMGADEPAGIERRRAIEACKEALIASNMDAIVVIDRHGLIIEFNAAAERMFGYRRTQVLGQDMADLLIPPALRDRHRKGMAHHLATGETTLIGGRVELQAQRLDGTLFPIEISLLRSENGGQPLFMAFIRDISMRRETEAALLDKEARYRTVAKATGKVVYDYDIASGRIEWAGAIEDIIGFTTEEFRHIDIAGWEAMIHPDDRDMAVQLLQTAMERASPYHVEYRFRHKLGHYLHVDDYGTFLTDESGQPVTMLGSMSDITERKKTEEKLRLAANALANTLEGVLILDQQRSVISANQAFTLMTGYLQADIEGRPLGKLLSGHTDQAFAGKINAILDNFGRWEGEAWLRLKSGGVAPVLISISAVLDDVYDVTHYVAVCNDISRYKDYEERLQYLALHDALTQLPNRALFQDRFRDAIARAGRHKTGVGLLFIDLDRFKAVNDSLGHQVGDVLLQSVAERLTSCLRATDTVARLGGDEFAVLLDELADSLDAAAAAQKLLDALAHPFQQDGHELFTSASIGISCYPDDGDDVHELLRNADTAMYKAKEHGRNTYTFFASEMNDQAYENLMLASSLQTALSRDEFILHYQPCVELASGKITGVEALIRWRHPELGLLPPGRFIPIAEETGLITRIGEWVLEQACRQSRAWRDAGLAPVRMAVNLSARQFRQPGLMAKVAEVTREYAVYPGMLELEITESMMMQMPERTRPVLQQLHDAGVSIAMDDFGTGYSSLSYLRHFPLDYLKIDRTFVNGIPDDADQMTITHTIIAMAKSLKIKLIAEGIETFEQYAFLLEQGCEEGQGYYFSTPQPPAKVEALLRKGKFGKFQKK